MAIQKKAGQFAVVTSADGWPQWCEIQMLDDDGTLRAGHSGLKIDDLKDLRYCLDEVIGKLERGDRS